MNQPHDNNTLGIREISLDELNTISGGSMKWIVSQLRYMAEATTLLAGMAVVIGGVMR